LGVFATNGAPLYPMIALTIGIFAVAGALTEYATRIALFRAPFAESFRARADCRARRSVLSSRILASDYR
jgi:hypothetical protein